MICVENDCQGVLKPETRNVSLEKGHRPHWCQTLVKGAIDGFSSWHSWLSHILWYRSIILKASALEGEMYKIKSPVSSLIFSETWKRKYKTKGGCLFKKWLFVCKYHKSFHIPFHEFDQHSYLISSLETHWSHHHSLGSHSPCFAWGKGNFPNRWSASPDAVMSSVHDGCAFVWTWCLRN